MKIKNLQKKYPKFVYQDYAYRISKGQLEILFTFKMEPDIVFRPKIVVEGCPRGALKNNLDNLVFHLGLIEMISYWKAVCSPIIEIPCGKLNPKQIRWWQKLIDRGLGQFFFENIIPVQKPKIVSTGSPKDLLRLKLSERILIAMAGGKDSIVSWEVLKKSKKTRRCFSLNPKQSRLVMKKAGCQKPIIIKRQLDKKLFELNRKGFLNGHTPFSAYLAFLGLILGAVFDYKYLAFSNERSSNEGNVKYKGKVINHQWSKSFQFEEMFRWYSKKYLIKEIEYFSFLRPLYEIQIAKLFSRNLKYLSVFLSCNEASKTYSGTRKPKAKWCGKCSKCLFVFAALYSFIGRKRLIKTFQKNLFGDKKLIPLMERLLGERGFKPFECVGTQKESLAVFYLSWKENRGKDALLEHFERKIMKKHLGLEIEAERILNSWNSQHNLSKELEAILRKEVSKKN